MPGALMRRYRKRRTLPPTPRGRGLNRTEATPATGLV